MPYPSAPEIQTSYTAQEQALGNGTLPGQELDVDLASIRASITELIEFVKGITRSDGKLANSIVTREALGSSLIIGFDPPAPWEFGVAYTTQSTVFEGFGFYLCVTPHTSSDFATDLASGRWVLLADLTPPGGALIAGQNLNDLPDKATARTNLGLGTVATANAGTGASQIRTNLQNEAIFQPLAANLTAWAALVGAANQLGYFTGTGTAALTTLSAFGRALIDDADSSAARATLGLGALATAASITTSEIAAATLVTAAEGIGANNNDTTIPTSAAVAGFVPFQCRAWVNFNGVPTNGTYSRTGNTVTVTMTGHGMTTGMIAGLDFTSGAATDGSYAVTVTDANTFTVQDAASGATSGNVTRNTFIRASGNVSSVTRNGLGDYTINFGVAIADAFYALTGSCVNDAGERVVGPQSVNALTTTSARITAKAAGTGAADYGLISVAIFR